jgi:hypothetical protein
MKVIVSCLFFLGLFLTCEAASYPFPPFNAADLSLGQKEVEKLLKEEPSYYDKSLTELRSIMTFGDYSEQQQAAMALVQAGDRETMLRVIYT